MTREERENALHCLKVMIGEEVCEECNLYGTTGTDHCEADCVRTAIEALEQQPCEDAISRQDALDALHMCLSTNSYDDDVTGDSYICYGEVEYEIEKLQSVQPKPKMGRWIDGRCSECGCDAPAYIIDWKWQKDMDANYCPNCGTPMINVSDINDGNIEESEEIRNERKAD